MSEEIEKIQRDIEFNPDIQKGMKDVTKNVFSAIYGFLGDRGFKKWLIDGRFGTVARRAIIREASAWNDKFFRSGNRARYQQNIMQTTKKPGVQIPKNKIVVNRKIQGKAYTLVYESYHALVDGYGGFSRFFGEGITERLAHMTFHGPNNLSYAYRENVEVISLLEAMYSDRVYKYFLTKCGSRFFYDLTRETSEEHQKIMSDRIKSIEEHLNKFHDMTYYNKGTIIGQERQKELSEGVKGIIENYYMYKRSQIQNFKYIKDGKVDFDRYIKEMAGIYIAYGRISGIDADFYHFNELSFGLMSELIESSHLLVGLSDTEKIATKERIMNDCQNAYSYEINYMIKNGKTYPGKLIDQEQEPYNSLNQNAQGKLIQEFIMKNSDQTTFADRLETLSKIATATNMTKEELQAVVTAINTEQIRYDGKALVDIAKKYSIASKGLEALNDFNDKEFETAVYTPIELGVIPEKKGYIEGTDQDKLSLVLLDRNSGEVSKIPLDRYGFILLDKGITIRPCEKSDPRLPESMKDSERIYEVFSAEKNESTFIGMPDDLSKTELVRNQDYSNQVGVKVSNGSISKDGFYFEKLRKNALATIVYGDMHRKIQEGRYSSNKVAGKEQQREEVSERHIFYDTFISDYNEIDRVFSGVDDGREELRNLSQALVDRTFEMENISTFRNRDVIGNIDVYESYEARKKEFEDAIVDLSEKSREGETTGENVYTLRNNLNLAVFNTNALIDFIMNRGREESSSEKPSQAKAMLRNAVQITRGKVRTSQIQGQIEAIRTIRKFTRNRAKGTEEQVR